MPGGRFAAIVAVAALCLAGAAARGGEPPPSPLAGTDVAARIALAQELEKKDPGALAAALSALSASKTKDPEREFLQAYVAQERDRVLRAVALEALSRLDRKAAAAWFRGRADGKEELATLVSLEALGHLGGKEDAPAVIELIKSGNELIAAAAADAAARLATQKDVEAIGENGLSHASGHVTDHAAWAIQDILKKPKAAAAFFEKIAGKKTDPRAVRAASAAILIEDKLAEPHEWVDSLTLAKKLVLEAPAKVEIKTSGAEYRKNTEAALDWLKKNMPSTELLVRAAVKCIDVPGKKSDEWVDGASDAIAVPLDRAVWPANKLALHIQEMATVLWMKRIGEPWKGHRGWEPAILDSYDLCVIARFYDAGPGGLSRANYMKDMIAKHPWGTQ